MYHILFALSTRPWYFQLRYKNACKSCLENKLINQQTCDILRVHKDRAGLSLATTLVLDSTHPYFWNISNSREMVLDLSTSILWFGSQPFRNPANNLPNTMAFWNGLSKNTETTGVMAPFLQGHRLARLYIIVNLLPSLKLTAKATENGWLEYYFPYGINYFQVLY